MGCKRIQQTPIHEHAVRGLRERRRRAHQEGDTVEEARLRAMESALESKLIPRICPDAVMVAGQSASAAQQGRAEAEWLSLAHRDPRRVGADHKSLPRAIRMLKMLELWPWQETN